MHPSEIILGIRFGDLRFNGILNVIGEIRNDSLYLHSNTSCCVDDRIEKDIQKEIQTLRITNIGQITQKIPTGKLGHFDR